MIHAVLEMRVLVERLTLGEGLILVGGWLLVTRLILIEVLFWL